MRTVKLQGEREEANMIGIDTGKAFIDGDQQREVLRGSMAKLYLEVDNVTETLGR